MSILSCFNLANLLCLQIGKFASYVSLRRISQYASYVNTRFLPALLVCTKIPASARRFTAPETVLKDKSKSK